VVVFFVILMMGHFGLATANWESGFMIGHEFRQAQTAIITDYIDRQDNFSLYYETPILGRPWAFPFEFPFYQWCVVGLKRALDLPDFQAARAVSLASFYLTLPALFLLLGSFKLPRAERLVVLAPLLVCPIYIFYSRSFLIDPMAAMFSAWFLAAFGRSLEERRWWWFLLATVAASLGILIKSVVFAVWLFPAALWGAGVLWQDLRGQVGRRRLLGTLGWGIGPVVLPAWLLHQWIVYTDALKWSHPAAYQFTSQELSQGNFGTFSASARLDPETWQILAQRWGETVGAAWFIGLTLAVGLVLNLRHWKAILGLVGLWLFGQLAFPYAYAFQDYYFFAGTFFLMLAFGFIIRGFLLSPRLPLAAAFMLSLLPLGAMVHTYWHGYGEMQRVKSNGGSGLTAMLRDMLPADSVIIGIGFDWSATIPYYSGHRALMVRQAQSFDLEYLKGAIFDLREDDIGALLITKEMQTRAPDVVEAVVARLGFGAEPILRFEHGGESIDIYVNPLHLTEILSRMGPNGGSSYPHVSLLEDKVPDAGFWAGDRPISAGSARLAFPMISEVVTRFKIFLGYRRYRLAEGDFINFHPDASIWVDPTTRAGTIRWRYGIFEDAWNRVGDRTDGVTFTVVAEDEAGQQREIFSRRLDPFKNEADRGIIASEFSHALAAGEMLRFSSDGGPSDAFDWAFLVEIEISE
jgi:hypothetical protein